MVNGMPCALSHAMQTAGGLGLPCAGKQCGPHARPFTMGAARNELCPDALWMEARRQHGEERWLLALETKKPLRLCVRGLAHVGADTGVTSDHRGGPARKAGQRGKMVSG